MERRRLPRRLGIMAPKAREHRRRVVFDSEMRSLGGQMASSHTSWCAGRVAEGRFELATFIFVDRGCSYSLAAWGTAD